ncbi:helix-turn-helix transcriptional regulator [Legionella quateirensis]|uniref:Transcription regulator protein, response regulator containing CheY-like receiver domain and HTH DNA-binding domain n=1 Tax=Legionella quateirensis TaxID=45072 RepID=A0A378KUX3_9GAMM|nr:hypothetical protein [Legionella quateirensis]KTD53033.1 hypothetical protein Lqua_0866 [Legionella quateirensis]STY17178.1 transcription regulator protein, response regulator containing CheY-like receiver domain and HTH DNA-binding domain [Legionella quateirensis]
MFEMTIAIPKNHISVSCGEHICEIAKPLLESGLSYFEHVRIYENGTIAWLSTNDERARSILENEIAGALDFDFGKLNQQRHMFSEDIVETIKDPVMRKVAGDKLTVSRTNYDIRNLFQLVSIKKGIYEAFVFGTNEKSNLQKSDYIKLIPTLEHFIFFYYDKAEKLIQKAEKEAIKIPGVTVDVTDETTPPQALTKANRYYFNLAQKNEYLTNREYEAIYLLNHGYSRKKIAEKLCLKTRTIDSLLANAIERNAAYNIRNLINKIKNSDIRYCLDLEIYC